jgi:hypothetical protein
MGRRVHGGCLPHGRGKERAIARARPLRFSMRRPRQDMKPETTYRSGTVATLLIGGIATFFLILFLGRVAKYPLIFLWSVAVSLIVFLEKKRTRLKTPYFTLEDAPADTPTLLYLRSFLSDSDVPSHVMSLSFLDTPEEAINQLYPDHIVVAFANPHEDHPILGARKIQHAHDEWQERALHLLDRSELIIARIGTTRSIIWELHNIWKSKRLHKTILFNPPDDRVDHRTIRHILAEATFGAIALPHEADGAAFIGFDDRDNPVFDNRYRKIYNMGDFGRDRGIFISLFRPPPYWSFLKWIRLFCWMGPGPLYLAEMTNICERVRAPMPKLNKNWRDYVLYYPLITFFSVSILFVVTLFFLIGIGVLE